MLPDAPRSDQEEEEVQCNVHIAVDSAPFVICFRLLFWKKDKKGGRGQHSIWACGVFGVSNASRNSFVERFTSGMRE